MRYYLLFIVLNLAAILAYTDFDEKGKIQIEKMKNHMRKIRTLLRNLDTSDEDDEEFPVMKNTQVKMMIIHHQLMPLQLSQLLNQLLLQLLPQQPKNQLLVERLP